MLNALIGHHHARQQLATMLENNRFPHAVLLHGPQGIGKRLLAEHLAYRLICGPKPAEASMFTEASEPSLEWDDASPVVSQIAAGSCPDYHVLTPDDGKKSISIKLVREVLEVLQRTADTSRTVIVDALEDLTTEAANTLLKTLEEPRPGIYFVLVCHQLSAVLPTIRSRCRLIPLRPLSKDQVSEVIMRNGGTPALAAVAQGAPGSVLGQGGQTRLKMLDQLKNGQFQGLSGDALLSVLLQHVRSMEPSLPQTEAYHKLARLLDRQRSINLPAALVQEAALAHLQGLK